MLLNAERDRLLNKCFSQFFMSESTENQEIPDAMRVAWDRTLKELENVIRPQFFQSFILTIKLLQAKETTLVLGFPEKFYRDWVHDHYSATIQEKFDEACGQNFKLEFAIEPRPSGRVEHRNSVLPPLDENSRVSASVPVTPPITIQPVRASNRSTLSAKSILYNLEITSDLLSLLNLPIEGKSYGE
jgi:hypothetical protein